MLELTMDMYDIVRYLIRGIVPEHHTIPVEKVPENSLSYAYLLYNQSLV